MGWQSDGESPDGRFHEGWVVAVERVTETLADGRVVATSRWRDVGADYDFEHASVAERAARVVSHVQVECECGWRSQRMVAPFGTEWVPCCTVLPAPLLSIGVDYEDAVWRLWRDHFDSLTAASASLAAVARERRRSVA